VHLKDWDIVDCRPSTEAMDEDGDDLDDGIDRSDGGLTDDFQPGNGGSDEDRVWNPHWDEWYED
jgi:hypothetical protein